MLRQPFSNYPSINHAHASVKNPWRTTKCAAAVLLASELHCWVVTTVLIIWSSWERCSSARSFWTHRWPFSSMLSWRPMRAFAIVIPGMPKYPGRIPDTGQLTCVLKHNASYRKLHSSATKTCKAHPCTANSKTRITCTTTHHIKAPDLLVCGLVPQRETD